VESAASRHLIVGRSPELRPVDESTDRVLRVRVGVAVSPFLRSAHRLPPATCELWKEALMKHRAERRRREMMAPAERERQLLEVTRQLLLEEGSAELTVQMVTDAIGVAKGTFYIYFDSKDHLLARLRADNLEHFVASMQAALADSWSSLDSTSAADNLIEQMIRYDVANAALHRAVLFRACRDPMGLLHGADKKVIGMLASAIHAAGASETHQSETTAALLYYGVNGLLNSAYRNQVKPDVDSIITAAREMIRRSLHGV
jgi:AcrR family transcriptional regulator